MNIAVLITALSTGICAALGADNLAKPELCLPKSLSVALQVKADHEKRLERLELEKLKTIVAVLGGKPEHATILQKAGREFEIDPVLLASVTFVESSFNPQACSNKNALGMMQLRPIVLNVLGVTNPWNPHDNIMAGAAYLRNCFDRYGNHEHSTYLVLASYNIGPGSVEKLTRSEAAERFVKKVLKVYNRFTDVPIIIKIDEKNVSKKLQSSKE